MSQDHPRYRELLRRALLIRRFEERVIELYPSDKIQSPVHLSIGQEAVAVGLAAALQPQDWVFGSYRSHALYIALQGDLGRMMAELYGRVGGIAKGKAGSMHLTCPEQGMMGSSAVVASHIPHAVGAALAAKARGLDQVIVALFGDAAMEEGVMHESLNFAALKKLPILFVCENNGFAVHAGLDERQSFTPTSLADAYGLSPARIAEGWSPTSVLDQLQPHIDRVRAGGGVEFVEIATYRSMEHVGIGTDFHAGYRNRKEFEAWSAKDPLIQDAALVESLEHEIAAEIEAAVQFAEASPVPGREELLSDVW